jgi:phosphoribosyl 1,2-cyclic phosphodiesterase
MRYGGNTSCVELLIDGIRIILDAGTGLRELGKRIAKEDNKSAYILFSHTHWDHVCGFPFFSPAFIPAFSFKVLAGHLRGGSIKSVLAGQMMKPLFPIPLGFMRASMTFEDFVPGSSFSLGPDITVRTAALNHPDNATGYRIEHQGRSFCYVTDTEHVPGHPDEAIIDLIRGADVVVYDCTYSDEEFPRFVTWGHSTWQEGVRLCRAAGAKHLVLFHHDPEHTDTVMDGIAAAASAAWSGSMVAREGMEIDMLALQQASVA